MSDFRFQSRQRSSRRRQLLAATVAVIILFVLDVATGGAIRGAVRGAVSILWNGSAHARSAITNTGYFRTHRSLAAENAALRDQVAAYKEDAAAYDTLMAENEQLRALVHIAAQERGVTAPIVSSFRASPYGTFLVGAGEREGVRGGSLVLTSDGFVVGTVRELHAHTALVQGSLASGSDTDVIIGSTAATLEGRGGGNGRVELPRDIAVATSAPVIAPSLGSRPVGIVGRVESAPASASQIAYVQLPVNLSSLRYVYIVPPRD